MTRNPETTEAAKGPQQPSREEQVRQALSGLASSLRRIRESLQSAEQCSEALAVLAVSPAVTEGERAALVHAANVMAKLEHYGPGIVGHLLDTDDNEGEYLRRALDDLGIEADWTPTAAPSPAVTAAEDETRHHPKCFQVTYTPEQLVAQGLAPDQCDCGVLRLLDAVTVDTGASDLSSWTATPHRLAVDAKGYVWRAYEDCWSMAPVNPDNSPIPQPVTYYVPESAAPAPAVEMTLIEARGLTGLCTYEARHWMNGYNAALAAPAVTAVPAERCRECGHDLADNDHADWCTGRFTSGPAVPADPNSED